MGTIIQSLTQIPAINHADHDCFNEQFIPETVLKLQHCFWIDESSQTHTFSELKFSLENSLWMRQKLFSRTALVSGQINTCSKLCQGGSVNRQKHVGGVIGTRAWVLLRKTHPPGSVWTSPFLTTRASCSHLWETEQHALKILNLSWRRWEKQISATITLSRLDGPATWRGWDELESSGQPNTGCPQSRPTALI